MKKRDHSKTAGFTLIELLVVIAILAILVAVGIPVYTGYISRANDAAVTTELGAVLTAAEAANATNPTGETIKTITVSGDGTIKVELNGNEPLALPNNYYQELAFFYGAGKATGNESVTIDSLRDLLNKSDTYKSGATWSANKWVPGVN
ncbi:MAG: prepilin-type N-terminal cleavage/methylation domain-containing protein [Oscillospiraceae bacterium]|nr:prepilin-type N-terminal cleavage/methylation domain-containing protein [Oscillospiraceae bacterium]